MRLNSEFRSGETAFRGYFLYGLISRQQQIFGSLKPYPSKKNCRRYSRFLLKLLPEPGIADTSNTYFCR